MPSTIGRPISWRLYKEATGGRRVDVVLDIVGGEYACSATSNRLPWTAASSLIGQQGGPIASRINTVPVLWRRLDREPHPARASVAEKGAIAKGPCTST